MRAMADDLLTYLAPATIVTWHRPCTRFELDQPAWRLLVERMAEADWSLLGLWADVDWIHMALRDEVEGGVAVASVPVIDGRYPAVSPVRPGAIRLERVIRDLWGHEADGAVDTRPWLDHGRWPDRRPLSPHPVATPPDAPTAEAYAFLPATGDGLHQVPVGPIHAGIIEPGHFRFTANGETVVRLEARLGWLHKGIESLMQGLAPADAARLACRISGDSAVAHALAFARAAEAAADIRPPPRADWLRAVMAELERIANHLGDIGAICNDVAYAFMSAECGVLRERCLRAAAACFGHRLMFDRIVPGGVAGDIDADQVGVLRRLVHGIRPAFRKLIDVYDNQASLADRLVGTGTVRPELVHRFAAGGFVGRASLRAVDARKAAPYPPYDKLDWPIPLFGEGDVNARVWVRIREVEASLDLIDALLDGLPGGPIAVAMPARAGEGLALVEGFRGEIMTWVRLDAAGRVGRCHPRDPSWFQWPLLEAAIEGNIIADFPVCNKSFNCSYAGVDL
ncbi:MAG: nickel-dependent hydrogenase large subunit [Alphaproteobacteria bacterium]|nr:nickel-dependent hydrogenase large subunit [Alphaproteobacteria bacterium]